MGASHSNDPSTAHASSVPSGSLKFHTPGKSGGFGSFTVNATSFIARQHDGDGTLLYTHTARGPRDPTPAPAPPPLPPTPAPAGKQWECHENEAVDPATLNLKDKDLGDAATDLPACQVRCNGLAGCTAVLWHKSDVHCHLLSGATPTHDAFIAALSADTAHDSCALLNAAAGGGARK
jgi:hypothetical protein